MTSGLGISEGKAKSRYDRLGVKVRFSWKSLLNLT